MKGIFFRTTEGDATLHQTDTGYLISWLWIRPNLRHTGAGRRMILQIKQQFNGIIKPVSILPEAKLFWIKMEQENLVIMD